jgi:hypothetical protein
MQSGYNIASPAERLADGVVQSVNVVGPATKTNSCNRVLHLLDRRSSLTTS